MAVAAREAVIDFLVESAADSFADTLKEVLVRTDDQLRLQIKLTCNPCAAAFKFAKVLFDVGCCGMGSSRMSVLLG